MKTLLLIIMLLIIPSLALSEQPNTALQPVKPLTLVCQYNNGNFHTSQNFVVDYEKHTVNNIAAEINDNMIVFKIIAPAQELGYSCNMTCNYFINRLNGESHYDCNSCVPGALATGPGPSGSCITAKNRLF